MNVLSMKKAPWLRVLMPGALLVLWANVGFSASTPPTCTVSGIQAISPGTETIISASTQTVSSQTYCKVAASFVTTNPGPGKDEFEVDLPGVWNNRVAFFGNLGAGGSLNQSVGSSSYNAALAEGYVMEATDTGHESTSSSDASFALIPAQLADYSYRSVHLSKLNAGMIIQAYYGSAPLYSYFKGCSDGGKQGLVEAQLYPTDFNGIISEAPAIGDPFAGMAWNMQAILASADAYITPDAINLVNAAVLNQCDGLDGVVDGLVQNPQVCVFDPATLQCASGQTPPGCLTAGMVASFNAIYKGPVDTKGNSLYPGYSPTDPAGQSGWESWITGCAGTIPCVPPKLGVAEPWGTVANPALNGSPNEWIGQDQYLKYFVFANADYNSLTFSFTNAANVTALNASVNKFGASGMNPQIQPFFNNGGKLFMYAGWSDPAITPYINLRYYTSLQAVFGATALKANARLFMEPGGVHCGGGPGPTIFDSLAPTASWVESGILPDNIVATHKTSGVVDRSMPLCAYPETAHYNGSGSVNSATNWSCS
jgi:feruloyl esterase